jgi:hypothetical protein
MYRGEIPIYKTGTNKARRAVFPVFARSKKVIRGVSLSSAIPSIGYAITASQSGRMSLPVARSAYIYSHFRHVSGVPAPEGSRGVSINRLKVLDVLIEQLAQLKKRPEPALAKNEALSDRQIDALIDQYEGQIRQARAAGAAMPYKSVPAPQPGILFNLGV